MKTEIVMSTNYDFLTNDEIETMDGGVSYGTLLSWLGKFLGEYALSKLLDHVISKTYTALLNATKKYENAAYQAWNREFNRHQYCCQGNGIGKGCPGRG